MAPPKVCARRLTFLCISVLIVALINNLRVGTEKPVPDAKESAQQHLRRLLTLSGDTASFAEGSAGVWFLQDGFRHPDPQGAILGQAVGEVRFFVVHKEPVGAEFLLSAFPFDGSPSMRVTLRSSIDEVSSEIIGVESLSIALDGDAFQEIQIECDEGLSPFQLDLGADLRRQCLRILEMSVSMEQL